MKTKKIKFTVEVSGEITYEGEKADVKLTHLTSKQLKNEINDLLGNGVVITRDSSLPTVRISLGSVKRIILK